MHSTDKASLRSEILAARRTRSPDALDLARSAIRGHVVDRARALGWQTVAAYVPMATEPGSVLLLAELDELSITVLVPERLPDNDLAWTPWSLDDTAEHATLGPDAIGWIDAVLAPALAVSPSGARLGRGGGSYDRALARVPHGIPIVALLFDDEIREDVPVDEWDVPVSAVVTPTGWRDLA